MTKKHDYTQEAVEAARSVMLELIRLLGEYRDDFVLIGGWVPGLIIQHPPHPHVGSMDIDLALNHLKLQEVGYKTIRELLLSRGYIPDNKQPFIFRRTLIVGGRSVVVQVDLLAGEYQGTGRSHRTQQIQDVMPRKARGCDLAFINPIELRLSGTMPDGSKDSAVIKVCSVVPFIVMKGMALYDRLKEKDSYDIYYCVRHFPGGIAALSDAFRPHMSNGLVKEGLLKIREKFLSPSHIGPVHLAVFLEISDAEEREILMRDAYERINAFLEKLL